MVLLLPDVSKALSATSIMFTYFGALMVLISSVYIVYYRYLHPLSKYPGPLLASFSNFWKLYHLTSLRMPQTLIKVHQEFGDVVRVGPNDLSFSTGSAVTTIYKTGRSLPKTKFYDGFTTFNPNLFGTQDNEIHAVRRRQMAHAFSFESIKEMEFYIDKHLVILRKNLDHFSDNGEGFDFKELIAFFVIDVLGELAFSESFDSQTDRSPDKLPPINDHIYLACLMGMMPEMMPLLKAVAPWIPHPWLQRLFGARKQLRDLTARCVRTRLNEKGLARKDLLTCLINAVDPESGAKLTELDISTEAFAMVVAGSHTTSGTLTLLFSHILQNPDVLEKVVSEIDTKLSSVTGEVCPIEGLEQNLPYTMACIQENFRINPVFTMPLPRKVTQVQGFEIDGHLVPQGTAVFSLNHVVHHNPSIWGPDHDVFNPARFLGPDAESFKRNLSPFSIGHRTCIGRNMAMTNMIKLLTTVLKHYMLELEDPNRKISTLSVGIAEKEGPLLCRVQKRGFSKR